MGKNFGGKAGDFPITEQVSDQLVRLPFHNGLTYSEQEQILRVILSFKL